MMYECVDLPIQAALFEVSFGREHILLRAENTVFHLSAPLELRDASGAMRATWTPEQSSMADTERFARLLPRLLARAQARYDGTLSLLSADGEQIVALPERETPYESWYAVGVDVNGVPWTLTCASGSPEVFVIATGSVVVPRRDEGSGERQ